jgi:hypothetical protein
MSKSHRESSLACVLTLQEETVVHEKNRNSLLLCMTDKKSDSCQYGGSTVERG